MHSPDMKCQGADIHYKICSIWGNVPPHPPLLPQTLHIFEKNDSQLGSYHRLNITVLIYHRCIVLNRSQKACLAYIGQFHGSTQSFHVSFLVWMMLY